MFHTTRYLRGLLRTGVGLSMICLTMTVTAQVDIVTEGFETDGETTRYVSSTFNDGSCNFFNRTNDNDPNDCYPNILGNLQGSWYWASEDIDEGTNPNLTFSTLTLNAANVTGFSSLEVRLFMAVGRPGAANFVWENDDIVRIQYQMDGGGYVTIGQFVGNGDAVTGADLQQDTDLNGVANSGAPIITTTFTEYTFAIPVTGNNLNVRVRLEGHDGSEEFAFDQIRIRGVMTVNMSPVLANIEGSTIMYTEGNPATQVTNTITVSDADDVNMESATISIISGFDPTEDVLSAVSLPGGIAQSYAAGVLTLSGTASVANYQTALRNVRYQNTDVANPSTATRTVRFQVNDGDAGSNFQSRNIMIIPVVNPPAALPYCESFETDGEGTRYTSATFNDQVNCDYFFRTNATPSCFATAITGANGSWYWASEDVVNGTGGGIATMVLSPLIATGLADFDIDMLLGVTTPTGSGWETDDYVIVEYNMDGGAWTIVGAFYGTGGSPGQLSRDTDLNGSADGASLTNTLTNYTFSFNATGTNLNVRVRVHSNASEELAFDNICVTGMAAQVAPTLANIEGTALDYTEGTPATQVTNSITVSDPDDTNMDSARIWFCSGYVNGQDVLAFTPAGGITGSFNASTGVLTLTGNSSIANYQAALRSVTYVNTNTTNPANHQREVCFRINDGDANSNTVSRFINVIEVLVPNGCLPITESFETDGEGTRYNSNTFNDVSNCDIFLRVNSTPSCLANAISGVNGSWYWASEDVISAASGNLPGMLTLAPMNVTDFTGIQAVISFAVSNNAGGTAWDQADNIFIQYNMDGGGWNTFGLLQGDSPTGGNLRIDLDNNPGTFGPYGTTVTNAAMLDLTFNVPVTGNSLEVRIIVDQDGGTEELAFDNIRVSGTYNGMVAAMCNNITVYLPEGDYSFPPEDSAAIVAGTDECAGYIVIFNPAVLSCPDVGENDITVYFTNIDGDTLETCSSILTLLDTIPPSVSCSDITVYLDGSGMASITVSDVGGGTDFCDIASTEIDISDFDCNDVASPVPVTVTVTDNNDNTATCIAQVTVRDTVSPVITCPGDVTVFASGSCEASLGDFTGVASASDNCGMPIITQSPMAGTILIGESTNQVVILTATDIAGNTSTCSFNFTLQDTTLPAVLCMDITIQIDGGSGMATINASQVDGGSSDNCGDPVLTVSQTTFTCADVGQNMVVLTATDEAGNTATCLATVTVEDPTNFCCALPVALCQDITLSLDGNGNAFVFPSDVNNGSTADCGLEGLSVSPAVFDCSDIGGNQVTLTVTDINNNTSSCTATVTIIDDLPPTIMCPNNVTINCAMGIPAPDPQNVIVDDNCGVASVVFNNDVVTGECPIVVSRSYIATDVNGNTAACTHVITIVDTTPPVISCPSDEISCDDRVCLDFDDIVVNPLGPPVVVNTVVAGGVTVTVTAKRKGNIVVPAALFNADMPIGDPDLGTPNTLYGGPGVNALDPDGYNANNNKHMSRLLIIQDPAFQLPNDHILGDSLCFVFSEPVHVSGLTTVDFEMNQITTGAGVFMYGVNGSLLGFVPLNPALGGDNSMQELALNKLGVKKLVVYFGRIVPSSGGVGHLCFTHIPQATITDACNETISAYTESVQLSNCITQITRHYTATDACGNSSEATCVIDLEGDYAQPDIICPDDLIIDCNDPLPNPSPGLVIATDNCNAQGVFVTWVEDITEGEGCDAVTRRIYKATDGCGNESYCVQYITREDIQIPPLQLSARVMLSGSMTQAQPEMYTMLQSILPEDQPYSGPPFNYSGGEEVQAFPENIVDWVFLLLRDALTMETISQRCALVTSDGDIVDLDGVSPVSFGGSPDQYYVVVCHRNHLDVMSDLPVDFSDGFGNIDFTLGNAGLLQVNPGEWAMIKGDVNVDGLVNNTDMVALAPFAAVGYSGQYMGYDVNMDGLVNNTDLVILAAFASIGYSQGF